jgi:hypothetical protein
MTKPTTRMEMLDSPDPSVLAIPPEVEADEGFKPMVRAYCKRDGDDEAWAMSVQDPHEDGGPEMWGRGVATLSRAIGHSFAPEEQPHGSLMLSSGIILAALNATLESADPESLEAVLPNVVGLMTALMRAYGFDPEFRDGELDQPETAEADGAVQIGTIWHAPEVDCTECGVTHEAVTEFEVDGSEIEPEAFGVILAQMALRASEDYASVHNLTLDEAFARLSGAYAREISDTFNPSGRADA